MDIVAHVLWAGAGARLLRSTMPVSRATFVWMVGLAAAPDIVPMLPVAAYALTDPRSLQFALAYITATPGLEPTMPDWVSSLTHHLHCAMHSVVVLGVLTAFLWHVRGRFPIALLGWWSHVLIDIPTHSADYYAVPLFYPLSDMAFNGIAWTSPSFMAINYASLAMIYVWLYRRRRMHRTQQH